MALSPAQRKLTLTAHVTASVGWLGSVVGFLALSITGLASDSEQTVRAVYLAMEATGWYVLVPLSVGSLVTGLVQSLGTPWGLFRHYWVVAKLMINVFASVVLVMYTQSLAHFGDLAADPVSPLSDLRSPSPVLHAGAALLLLLGATVLSVYKPPGMTRHGQRHQSRPPRSEATSTRGSRVR